MAARLDDAWQLVCGALSSNAARAHESAAEIGLDPDRSYSSFNEMFVRERSRSDGMEAVAIVTPNHLHHPIARAALQAGFHVICDKPLATSVAEADELVQLAAQTQRTFAVTYNYSGYPMVRQARAMVEHGDIGALRVLQVEYPQAWLAAPLEATGQKQATWRTDPSKSGPGGAIGDIGSHAFHLACFVTRCVPTQFSRTFRRPSRIEEVRRQCARADALSERRPRHAVGQSGGTRPRKRTAPARLWRTRWTRMGAGGTGSTPGSRHPTAHGRC